MVVVLQVISAAGGNDVESVMSSWPTLARCYAGAIELIVGKVHLIDTEDSFQTTLVEGLVMSHQRQSLNKRLYLPPHFGEYGCILCIFSTKAMHLTTPVVIILRLWLDKRIELIHYLPTPHYHYANRAHRRAMVVGSLKIYGCEVLHIYLLYSSQVTQCNAPPCLANGAAYTCTISLSGNKLENTFTADLSLSQSRSFDKAGIMTVLGVST